MTYLELGIKVLEEAQRLLWVDEIWAIAKAKGYDKSLTKSYSTEEDNINMLDSVLYKNIGKKHHIALLVEQGLYYLTTFDNLPQLVEEALDGPFLKSYKEIVARNKPKRFSPSKRGFDGMVFFWVFPIGFPLSSYIIMSIQGSFQPTPFLLFGTLILTALFAPIALFHLYSTNCDIAIFPDKIVFRKLFIPQIIIASVPIKNLQKIKVKGIGLESQVDSDFKTIDITYKEGNKVINKRIRCHGYINTPDIYDPFQIRVLHHENFSLLRSILKEICVSNQAEYEES